jgi:hypothetical protein
MTPPRLKPGRFRAPDKLLAMLSTAGRKPVMRSETYEKTAAGRNVPPRTQHHRALRIIAHIRNGPSPNLDPAWDRNYRRRATLDPSQHCNRSSGRRRIYRSGHPHPRPVRKFHFNRAGSGQPASVASAATCTAAKVSAWCLVPVADAAQLSPPSLQLARMAPGFPRHRRDTGARLQRGCNQPLLLCRAPAPAALHRMIIQLQSCSCNYSYE